MHPKTQFILQFSYKKNWLIILSKKYILLVPSKGSYSVTGPKKNLKTHSDVLSTLFYLNASRNAEFTLPNTAHKFSWVAQSRQRSLKLPFYSLDFSFGAPLAPRQLKREIDKLGIWAANTNFNIQLFLGTGRAAASIYWILSSLCGQIYNTKQDWYYQW